MNGSGKTSLLFGLYLGLFGRHGLRFIEGLREDEDTSYYRQELQKIRRREAMPDEPTVVHLSFSPGLKDGNAPAVRLQRTWHFDSRHEPLQGDAFEELVVWQDEEPMRLDPSPRDHLDYSKERLERLLFPLQFLPAFFFDGEQAQRMIFEGGAESFQRDTMENEEAFESVAQQLSDQI